MILALLLSLLLHVLLLFFVQFAPPSWNGLSGGISALSVILDTRPAEVSKSSAIAKASQDSRGAAKIGVQDALPFPEQALAAARRTPVTEPKTGIPKDFVGKEILTVTKSAQVNMVASVPDLLATKEPAFEQPKDKEEAYAPAPSVAEPETMAPPPVEKLVSTAPVPGERHEKIVFAEAAQAKPPAKEQSNLPEVAVPVKIEEPKPVKLEEVKPARIEVPKPLEVDKPRLVAIEEPVPVLAAKPTPARIDEPKPGQTEELRPAQTEVTAEPRTRPVEAVKSDVFRTAPPAYKIPSLAELSIASARKFADEGRKIKFGERRKTVSIKEQDFRYAMYVESVRLKLQRIGMFNYPAAAARDNLTGTLSAIISIRADGSLEEFSLARPAAYAVLNEGAERIVRMSAPFSPLPDNIRQETDILSIRINWTFSKSSQSFD